MLNLKIEKREINTKLDQIRSEDKVPAVFYGKGVESTPVTVSASEFKSVWKKAGTSSLITLSGIDDDKEVVIQELDIDPLTSQVKHVDFYVIERGKVMEVEVPLEYVGISGAVKSLGGVLVKVMHTLNIEVLPKDLPQSLEVDITALENMDSQILVKDLKLPESAKALVDADEVVAAVASANEEEESTTTEADITSVEIEKKGKKEETEA